MITLRRALPGEESALSDWTDAHLRKDFFFRRRHWHDTLRDINKAVWVLEDEGCIVGIVVTYLGCMLRNLYLHPDYRGRGLGSTICSLLELKEVRAKTDMSTGDPTEFYVKNGFVPVRKEGKIVVLEKRRVGA